MKAKISLFLTLALLLLSVPAFTQDRGQGSGKMTVSGRVLDEQGFPVIGAGVIVKGSTLGTATDIEGRYTLSVPSNATLLVQSIGYRTAEIPVGHKIARRNIARGEKIIKYGVPIGCAVRDIPAGTWVHLQNMRSLYDERSSHLDVNTGAPKDTKYE